MTRTVALFAVIIAFATGCDARTDPEKLSGKWFLNSMSGEFSFYLGGAKEGHETISFTCNEFTFDIADVTGQRLGLSNPSFLHKVSGSFTCDATQNPKQITFLFNDRRVVGLYDLWGDTLLICVSEDGTTLPTKFVGGNLHSGRPRQAVMTFKRAQEKTA
jgi:uncharacterized protein (TIGR03067 family)